MSKLFTSILNKRLLSWSDLNSVVTDAQFGFKPGSGTKDAIFVLHSLISKTLREKKRLYCCFVDERKSEQAHIPHAPTLLENVVYNEWQSQALVTGNQTENQFHLNCTK